jgi:IS30 family transposase|tara:strand:+ start:466 stop:609 length:144 start_codon:yes stop_codon:yes gene_type:complete
MGNWEADTTIGQAHQVLVSLTERKSALALMTKIDRPTKEKNKRIIKF